MSVIQSVDRIILEMLSSISARGKGTVMIDNDARTIELLEDIDASLPIPARPTPELVERLQAKVEQLPPEGGWEIEHDLYLGDNGGIACGLRRPEGSDNAIAVSLTDLRIDAGHPLSRRICEYQSRRAKKLARLRRDTKPSRPKVKCKSQRKRR